MTRVREMIDRGPNGGMRWVQSISVILGVVIAIIMIAGAASGIKEDLMKKVDERLAALPIAAVNARVGGCEMRVSECESDITGLQAVLPLMRAEASFVRDELSDIKQMLMERAP